MFLLYWSVLLVYKLFPYVRANKVGAQCDVLFLHLSRIHTVHCRRCHYSFRWQAWLWQNYWRTVLGQYIYIYICTHLPLIRISLTFILFFLSQRSIPQTKEWLKFDNSYFKELLHGTDDDLLKLSTDSCLIADGVSVFTSDSCLLTTASVLSLI